MSLKSCTKYDNHCMSVLFLRLLFPATPEVLPSSLAGIVSSFAELRPIVIDGTLFGKKSVSTAVSDTRTIFPFPNVLRILDNIGARVLSKLMNVVVKHLCTNA